MCLCCNLNEISPFDFHTGHIIAKSKGGEMNKENLIPICHKCNLSMGNENMIDFMKRCKYNIERLKIKNINLEKPKLIIKLKMRNNQWGNHKQVFDTIRYTKKIICPWGHWKSSNKLFEEGKFNNEKFSNIFINDLKINELVCLFDRNYEYALILKINSDIITEKVKEIILLRNNKCNHKPIEKDCDKCGDSNIEMVFTDKYFNENHKEFIKYLNEDYHFENMYAILRKVEIIGRINTKCEFFEKGKAMQGSICRANSEILESDVYSDEIIKIQSQDIVIDKISKDGDKIKKAIDL